MVRRLDTRDAGFPQAYAALLASRGAVMAQAEDAARSAIAAVRAQGLAAVLDLTEAFDGVRLDPEAVQVPQAELDAALAACPRPLVEAMELAFARICAFHAQELPQNADWTDAQGMRLGWRWSSVDAAGVYAPGGLAAYPSSVLMNVAPARVAGVARIVLATPPGRAQSNPAILAAARIAGVEEVWRLGGAQAIAALAYGAGPLAPVDVIVGPGNAYVAAAKRLVFGDVGIDSVAGPSEVFIIADEAANPEWIACDLLAQAEHDPAAQSVLLTPSAPLAEAVVQAVARQLQAGAAGESAAASWQAHGAVVRVEDLAQAARLANAAAPEHLQLAVQAPDALLAQVRHAGAVFLGEATPEALGDYLAGPNHVLPTGRRARFSSGLSTYAFLKRTTLLGASPQAARLLGEPAAVLARAEGLIAHERALRLRLQA
jgi:histidinol dehydrogenase